MNTYTLPPEVVGVVSTALTLLEAKIADLERFKRSRPTTGTAWIDDALTCWKRARAEAHAVRRWYIADGKAPITIHPND